ncbi:nif-specific transcriptional activator NifA [Tropicimonas sp. IMCC34043]|uniref:nif-specific transcriptional activator NifA n=1 Tax=Tropicimonas sp. IMCC34043 TaxID=2248760 RepID=UPI000E2616AE|nr:nif-specific transcriptional activator NifA [Tropicimonas sp. IMCC34043]
MIEVAHPVDDVRSDQRGTRSAASRASEVERLTLNAVYEIAKMLTSAPDPIAVMPTVMNVLSSFLGLRHGALALLTEPDRPITAVKVNPYRIAATTSGLNRGDTDPDILPEAVAQMVFRTGVPLVSWDLAEDFGPEAVPERLRGEGYTLIAVPVREQTRSMLVAGVLCAYRSHEDRGAGLADNDIGVLTMVSSLLEQSLRFRRIVAQDRERVLTDARRALSAAQEEVQASARPVTVEGIVGSSVEISDVISRVQKVAPTRAPVLLRGESGTGKELFARAIHTMSDRKDKPFVRVNCAALSETLLESELFGHEKGAFTGASSLRKGRFELADGGTLFLDEIGEISTAFQVKLLRVLQEGEFERVGGAKTIKVDFRLVTATNRDLEEAVAMGKFRADLYFRICVVPIMLPPLRERPNDIRPLAELFLSRFNDDHGTNLRFAPDAFETICACKFPGNVRELENCVNRAAALSNEEVIVGDAMACNQNSCLSADLWRLQKGNSSPIGGLASGEIIMPSVVAGRAAPPPAPAVAAPAAAPAATDFAGKSRKTADIDREELVTAMEQAGWVQAKAARLLGMTPRQIAYALKKYDIEVRKI